VNIADIKKELSGDEKVLEKAFKLETYYNKYKFFIWALIIAVIVFFVGRTVMQSMQEAKLAEANEAFITLQSKADDADALSVLKAKNPALFELFTFGQAAKNKDSKTLLSLANSSNAIVADASAYSAAVIEKKKVDSKLYADISILQDGYLAIKTGDIKGAKAKLALITQDSPLSTLASLLQHSTIKGKMNEKK